MHTVSLKFPPHLEVLVKAEAKQRQISKSAIIRACVEEVLLKRPDSKRQLTCADLMGDLIGSQVGPPDASTTKRYLEEAIVKDFQRGRNHSHAVTGCYYDYYLSQTSRDARSKARSRSSQP